MSNQPQRNNNETEDSASVPNAPPPKSDKGKRNKGNKDSGGPKPDKPKDPTKPPKQTSEKSTSKSTPGFSEGNSVLSNYGLSVSGRKERILSFVKTDKYFHLVEQSWSALITIKPSISERFSYAEFRHCMALALYYRVESVKFDALGVKPAAPVRIPLPRNTRTFQPIWSVLANIGTVEDDDLRVTYIPDAYLPSSSDADSDEDLENLLACTLYDWNVSWNNVIKERKARARNKDRDATVATVTTNEYASKTERFAAIRAARASRKAALEVETLHEARIYIQDGVIYKRPIISFLDDPPIWEEADSTQLDDVDLFDVDRWEQLGNASSFYDDLLDDLMADAHKLKEAKISIKWDVTMQSSVYSLPDLTVIANPGSYGQWLHWDPQLWLEYEQAVEILSALALFSLGMPNETTGTYMWLLPVESREKTEFSVSARLPKASIPPVTWTLALLLQMSTLPYARRSTWYVETDRLTNVIGLRRKYILAAIKDPAAVEQFGTY